ncbi:unnamed protein product [Didymodactylos carnosus]|uniref:Uncharacterized protein n=1 Tax=Didymodactylos carnosus TaxID=1234261 RepID=A0A814FFC2_9BILA|nr:unnamed protein product [Didymodactylos carnosus]CAF0982082.1 unnamed protein product [Didymodactylos carnosus]CAF3580687.1 unnamed protein product [Didymodactylos carnosus]CAF3754602.1 unnamed protein product [Didymodactylos carnosus]
MSRNLAKQVQNYVDDLKKHGYSSLEGGKDSNNVLSSSADLFFYLRNCLEQCSKLSSSHPLLLLVQTFKKHLRTYANRVLNSHLPKTNTCALNPESAERISNFNGTNICRVCSIMYTAEDCLGKIQQFSWQTLETVEEQSTYVTTIMYQVQKIVLNVRDHLGSSRHCFTEFCIALVRFMNDTGTDAFQKVLEMKITHDESFSNLRSYINSHLISTVEFLKSKRLPSRNYLSSTDSKLDELVQRCHGASGFVYLFVRAYKFCEHCLDYGKHNLSRTLDHPYSLFKG